ncbi:AMP-binding protein [Halomonas sp. WWR20]
MLTTSGSTGIPKVVELSVEGVNAFFSWGAEYFQLGRGSRVLSYAPLNFDLSLLEIWTPLMQGATNIARNWKELMKYTNFFFESTTGGYYGNRLST